MSKDTRIELRNKVIYSVYVRNHSKEGTFKGVENDLDRIKELGCNILWLLPIHTIGQINRKGNLGSPYSIENYRKINSEYGTLEDFKHLIEETHKRGMKLIIDVVYNHTSYNSAVFIEHPEWFYRKANGELGNKVGDWVDIIDLDYGNESLWDYQINTLKYWISVGVDGFRCDVAPLVPLDFWIRARKEIDIINEDAIWLCESIDTEFAKYLNENNIKFNSDSEMYQAFDITYDYDTYKIFLKYLRGEVSLEYLIEKKRMQEYIYPANYIKLRFIENHDQLRAASLLSEEIDLKNWTSFMFFEKGMALIYSGQEYKDNNLPSLFEKDLINWYRDKDYGNFIKMLAKIKQENIFAIGRYEILESQKQGIIEARYSYKDEKLIGIFNIERKIGEYNLNIKDGQYINLIDEKVIEIKNGKIKLIKGPIIIKYKI